MKKYIKYILLPAVFMAITIQFGFAQASPGIKSKEEAIAILRSNEFLQIYRTPNCDSVNVEKFIKEIDKIVHLEAETAGNLKEQLLRSAECEIVIWPLSAPFISKEVGNVLRNNFTDSEYNELSSELAEKLIKMSDAYRYLSSLRQQKEGVVPFGYPGNSEYIDTIYDYFDI